MLPPFDEFFLTESAGRHGFDERNVAEVLERPCLVIRNRRGRSYGYEIFGRNAAGEYLLLAARRLQYGKRSVLRVYHAARMTSAERRRYLRHQPR